MPDHTNTEEIRIKALLEAWPDAVRRHDIPAILAHREPDIVMFDLPPPLQCKGIEAYERTWDLLFRYHKPGTAFDIQELTVTAGQDVAFAVAIMRCGPDSSSNPAGRFPVGPRKVNRSGASHTNITPCPRPTSCRENTVSHGERALQVCGLSRHIVEMRR